MTESVVATEFLVAGTDKTKYMCELCNISFAFRKNLNQHLKKFHELQILGRANKICPLCDEKVQKMALLVEHLQNQHSINLNFVDKTFYTEEDFLDWKSKIEKETLSYYVLRSRSSRYDTGITHTYYDCHRSGSFKIKQNRTRSVKASGSVKTGSTCPACIKVSTETHDDISEIKVQYQSVHLGHDLDTRCIRLTKLERENLASCLKLGISIDTILKNARQNPSLANCYRHLTRKHLHNIRRDFGIPRNNTNFQKARTRQDVNVESSDSSIGYEDCVEIEASNEEMQLPEENSAMSLLCQIQNNDYYEELKNRKIQIIDQLKLLQSRIENWDPQSPLPDVEIHIKALNAFLDISAPSNRSVNGHEMLPIFTIAPSDKPTIKRRRITKTKKGIKN